MQRWSRVQIEQSMNDRREPIVRACGERAWTHGWAFLAQRTAPEQHDFVVYVSSRWRPIRIAYESSAAPRVRFASIFLAAVGMSHCDFVYRGRPWRQHMACSSLLSAPLPEHLVVVVCFSSPMPLRSPRQTMEANIWLARANHCHVIWLTCDRRDLEVQRLAVLLCDGTTRCLLEVRHKTERGAFGGHLWSAAVVKGAD